MIKSIYNKQNIIYTIYNTQNIILNIIYMFICSSEVKIKIFRALLCSYKASNKPLGNYLSRTDIVKRKVFNLLLDIC